jgi:ribosomal protein S7
MAFVARTSAAPPMKDYRAKVEKLRRDAADCALIRDLATEKDKREMFDRLSNHLTVLADQVEMAMNERRSGKE